ncbi:sensor histidine kinase [Paenibacillus terreus]|uniref:histidine kinase n=1 Tax=Paenibacillus terreus TaxID=1387834 RepID=A0ABV5B344_9BACL
MKITLLARPLGRLRAMIGTLPWRSIRFLIGLSFTLLTVFIVLIVSGLLYNKFSSTAEENAYLNIQQIIGQVSYNLEIYVEGMMGIYEVAGERIAAAEDISDSKLHEQLSAVLGTRQDVVSFALFTPEGDMVLDMPDRKLQRNTNLTSQSWFESALRGERRMSFSPPHIQNLFPGQYKWVVSMSGQVAYRQGGEIKKGILLVDVNFKTIDELSKRVSLGKRGYVYIIDSQGNIVYHPQQQLIYAGLKYENIEPVLSYSYGRYIDHSTGEERLITVKTVNPIGWKIVGVAFPEEILTTKQELNSFIVWFLAEVLIVVLILSVLVSASISKPIQRLEKAVRKVEKGDLYTPIQVRGADEIEQLSGSFNRMLTRIRELMEQSIREQEAKRKSELDVLQAQINPHFLYNTLNTVIRLAERGQNDEVVKAITSLSKFFRISLSKGKQIISLGDELEHVRHYLIIQKVRYKERFDFVIEADEGLRHFQCLKLILQPIVENAIVHGIEEMADKGFIRLRTWADGGDILITVSDNGLGMTEGTLERILTGEHRSEKGSGVGVANVHKRIRLYYGDGYGLHFESELEEGTTVTIRIPVLPIEDGAPGRVEA